MPFDWRFLSTGLDVFHYSSFLPPEFSFIKGKLGKSGFKKRSHTYEVKTSTEYAFGWFIVLL